MQTLTPKEKPQGTQELLAHLGVSTQSDQVPTNIDQALAETSPVTTALGNQNAAAKTKPSKVKAVAVSFRKFIPYVIVFGIGIAAFIILFTNVSFTNLTKIKSQPVVQQASAQTVPAGQVAAYDTWINSYFFDVSNPAILDPNYDYSGNGLTNYQKFLLGLNPTKQDTAGIGMTDSEALIAGINPLNGKQMTDSQLEAVSSTIDLEDLSNRLALQTLGNDPAVVGTNITAPSTDTVPATTSTSPATTVTPSTTSTSSSSDETAATTALQTSTDQTTAPTNVDQGDLPPINTSINGSLNIPDLKITVPLIWGATPNAVDTDLQSGVVHYPGTALPGQIGTAYISGHSSNYVWAKGSYNKIFSTLGNLKKNASFTITATSTSGKKMVFHYVVTSSGIFSPTNQKQFASIGKSTVGLSTCWPVGTSTNRLVVFGQLVQVEQN